MVRLQQHIHVHTVQKGNFFLKEGNLRQSESKINKSKNNLH